ncbi:hypothetical protein NYE80_13205 [Paenibacillus sp. FSL H7-0357]|nr:hypothetical protein [Paenibacillus sp. FSL H7-0357]
MGEDAADVWVFPGMPDAPLEQIPLFLRDDAALPVLGELSK